MKADSNFPNLPSSFSEVVRNIVSHFRLQQHTDSTYRQLKNDVLHVKIHYLIEKQILEVCWIDVSTTEFFIYFFPFSFYASYRSFFGRLFSYIVCSLIIFIDIKLLEVKDIGSSFFCRYQTQNECKPEGSLPRSDVYDSWRGSSYSSSLRNFFENKTMLKESHYY